MKIFTEQEELWPQKGSYPGWKGCFAVPTASWAPEWFQASQGWHIFCQLLVFTCLESPVHSELGHICGEEVREDFHVLREAVSSCKVM